ncbi:DNA transposase THAP9 [Collichthys lucidus]|uniref:DNA transposase THAP9 n=1 Tax=Collichthys lucidus TaxID=240159 RepID=A0A4U5U8A8_COLLU|nr:DNA transposase THAP9 [Collichthys lucidus]
MNIETTQARGSAEERSRLKEQRKQQATEHSYALPGSPEALKAKLEAASARVRKLEREKSNALRREKRAKNNMQALLEELKEKNLINEELKDKLECYSDLPVHLLSKQGVEYTKAQRDFALTLHLHGPKAYHYLRDTLHIHLPHPSSLQRWLALDARPGLNKMMLDMLERRRQEDEDKYGCVTLMLDAMSIKKHVQHDPQTQTMLGYVDMGDRLNETDLATEALVFMVVSLAAQTLNNSVAVALRTLQDLDYAEFRDSEATSEFIKKLDKHQGVLVKSQGVLARFEDGGWQAPLPNKEVF